MMNAFHTTEMMEERTENNKYCYITLDYELFLGSHSGTVDNCLVKPTQALCTLLDGYGFKATFFVDAAYLYKLSILSQRNIQLQEDFEKVCENIRVLSTAGHSIQLHFHPQWLYSHYVNDVWHIDAEHYKIDDMGVDEINVVIPESIDLLNSLIQIPVSVFRAGGYTINDFGLVRDIFLSKGITSDSSVLRGMKYSSEYQQYDYTSIPDSDYYHFEEAFDSENSTGRFTEYPITTMPTGGIKSFYDNLKIKYAGQLPENRKWGDGYSVAAKNNQDITPISRILRYFKSSHRVASIDGVKSSWLQDVMKYRFSIAETVVVIGHPKLLTPYSLNELEKIIKMNPQIRFKSF